MKTIKAPVDMFARVRERVAAFDRTHPIIRTEYRVEEITKGWYNHEMERTTGQGFLRDSSPWFQSDEDRQAWLDKHEPDDNCEFRLAKRVLRSVPATEKWYSV